MAVDAKTIEEIAKIVHQYGLTRVKVGDLEIEAAPQLDLFNAPGPEDEKTSEPEGNRKSSYDRALANLSKPLV